MKKIVFGIVYFIAFYFGACVVLGAIAGAKIGASGKYANDSEALQRAAGEAGGKAVEDNLGTIVGVSLTLSIAGAAFGILPGTGSRRQVNPEELLGARLPSDGRYHPA